MSRRGDITREFTVWCGRCHVWLQLCHNTKKVFIADIRHGGWRQRKISGWVCPDCVQELKEGKTKVGWRHTRSDRG